MCLSRHEPNAAAHGKEDTTHEKGAAMDKGQKGAHQGRRPIRMPTMLVRNKRPRPNLFEKVIDVSLLGLPRHNSAEAAYLHHFSEHLRQAYFDARGRREKLTQGAFIDFLQRIQGEEVVSPPTKTEYTYEEFLEEWTLKYGLGALRNLTQDQRDPSKPISNYFISSSHNTYLEGHQIYSESSSKIYQKVLERHCRCIEIDVWDGDMSIGELTPTRSKSPDPTHKRHHSSSSLPTYEGMKQRFIVPKSPRLLHSRRASAREPVLTTSVSTGESSSSSSDTLHPDVLIDRVAASQGPGKSSLNKSEPMVMHAWKDPTSGRVWTLTQPVGFREVCKAVRKSAFAHDNHLPIIVSLEVHACFEQQEVMVKIMKEEWAGLLLDKPFDDCDPQERQPRLDELMDKILVKVKRAASKTPVSTPKLPSTSKFPQSPKPPNLAVPAQHDDDLSPSDDERCEHTGEKKTPICPSLAALAIYTHSEHFKSFGTPSARTHGHIFSIVEGEIRKLYERSKNELLEHNRHFFMRAYPHPVKRMASHNPDPSVFWRKGVQMVALNWQDEVYDKMALHDAMFTEDTKGWVLKPPGYRSTDSVKDIEYQTLQLRITIYGGRYLPLTEAHSDKVDSPGGFINGDAPVAKHFRPFVEVDLAISHEKANGKRVQKTVQKTPERGTVNPDWGPGGYTLEFINIQDVVEELSFVRFKIEHKSKLGDQVAAWACIRLDRLRQGYRFIDLADCKGNPTEGKLFVRIDKQVRQPSPMGLVKRKTMKWWDQVTSGR